jgi:NAD(P)-dependent dehydrogenase (short-subunit alcohol dehydrogenase family)
MSLFDLTGKVVAVTGATKGIGLGIARAVADQGAQVIISSRNQAACDEVAASFNKEHGREAALGLACSLDDRAQIQTFIDKAPTLFGGLDALICNAAILPYIGPSAQTPPDLFDRILVGNIHNNFLLCQGLRPAIARRGGGSIVMVTSIAAHTASPFVLAYGAAKAGVLHMALCLADEMAPDNIRVNCVSPGLIRSFSSTDTLGDEGLAAAGARMPLRRVGEAKDIAGAVVYLISEAGEYVSGESILVDGGAARLSTPNEPSSMGDLPAGKSYD